MGTLMELLAVLALMITGLAVMVGAVHPGEALRRVGVVLVLLLVVPCIIFSFIQSVIMPIVAAAVTQLANAAVILLVVAAVALLGWFPVHIMQRRSARNQRDPGESKAL